MRKWHKGFPPFTGWWNASTVRNENVWRWFDAETQQWGQPFAAGIKPKFVKWAATTPALPNEVSQIKWTDYWPKNARVPRIDPRKEG